ncbi:HEAT repeat domain-containing protein [Pedosphaera parvula]|uniref:HEAT repeat domain-containing protein n=1 Tax=Pedosphaera parvula TaxID=1032527 RepID=UPI00135F1138|nr:HEAT repeat domain-containing protein [Pedosphaera parvula]
MRKRSQIVFAVFVIAILGIITWGVLSSHEPVHAGKPLSAWCEQYGTNHWPHPGSDSEKQAQAETAIQYIGTNAFPTLLVMLRANDSSPWKRRLLALAYKQHLFKIQHVQAWRQNWQAACAFTALGAKGSNAVPALIELYNNPPSAPSQRYTAMTLGNIGPAAKAAIPSLIQAAEHSGETEVRAYAINALSQIRPEPGLVLPTLIKCLNDSSTVQNEAMDALIAFGPGARPAVPTLIQLLQNPNTDIVSHAQKSLSQIDPAAAAKAGVK